MLIGDSYEMMGVFAKTRMIDRKLLMDIYSALILDAWNALTEVTAILRAHYGRAIYENFEYLVVLAQDWNAAHPEGAYPRNARRVEVPYKWTTADKHHAATVAT